MTSNQSEAFGRALDKFKKKIPGNQISRFTATSLADVEQQILDIQNKDLQVRGLDRLRKFLDAMKQLEELVKVFLNVSEIASFIWVSSPPPNRNFATL